MRFASAQRREVLRTNLWLVPTAQVAGAALLFVATYALDRRAADGAIDLPSWVDNGSADAARQILTAIAAAVITVVGVVFSITIVALTLASTQFGPRMLRSFVRDRGTQVTLGTFVGTFVYTVLALGSVSSGQNGDFVPHLSITVAIGLVLLDLGVLIFFIHHMATSIQLPGVIAGIANDLARAIDAEVDVPATVESGLSPTEILLRLEESGAVVPAPNSGYLQFVGYSTLVEIATASDAIVRVLHRPGHFVTEGLPMAVVWPAEAAPAVGRALAKSHATGPHRTLVQDLSFAIDQLVEIALRALSPAVNDTFSALTCVDWLGDGLCKLASRWAPRTVHRDDRGAIRVLATAAPFERFVDRSYDKIRQASAGMPAVMIRQLEALAKVMEHVHTAEHRRALLAQADMILRSSEASVPEACDREDVARRHERVLAASRRGATSGQQRSVDVPRD